MKTELGVALSRLRMVTLVLYILVAAGLVFVWRDSTANHRDAERTTKALCSLRDDLQHRVQASTDFLVENPRGIPGISPKVIRDGIRNQQRTIKALKVVKCP